MFNLTNRGAKPIQEITVMRYQQQSTLIIFQVIFQPHDSLKIQMVGRFVQNQQRWFFQQQFCNCQSSLFPTAETGNFPLIGFCTEAHAVQHHFDFHINLIAVITFKISLQTVIFFRCCFGIVRQLLFQLSHACLCIQQRLKDIVHLMPNRLFFLQTAHLFQIADTGMTALDDFAVPFLNVVGQNPFGNQL